MYHQVLREYHADPESFFQRGSNFEFLLLFVVVEGIQIPIIVGHHRPASKTPFKWRAVDGPSLNAGLVCDFSVESDQYC